jgi:hypothetical protein
MSTVWSTGRCPPAPAETEASAVTNVIFSPTESAFLLGLGDHSFRSSTFDCNTCRLLKATTASARRRLRRASNLTRLGVRSDSDSRESPSSLKPLITVSRLLKSWANPPPSVQPSLAFAPRSTVLPCNGVRSRLHVPANVACAVSAWMIRRPASAPSVSDRRWGRITMNRG